MRCVGLLVREAGADAFGRWGVWDTGGGLSVLVRARLSRVGVWWHLATHLTCRCVYISALARDACVAVRKVIKND